MYLSVLYGLKFQLSVFICSCAHNMSTIFAFFWRKTSSRIPKLSKIMKILNIMVLSDFFYISIKFLYLSKIPYFPFCFTLKWSSGAIWDSLDAYALILQYDLIVNWHAWCVLIHVMICDKLIRHWLGGESPEESSWSTSCPVHNYLRSVCMFQWMLREKPVHWLTIWQKYTACLLPLNYRRQQSESWKRK